MKITLIFLTLLICAHSIPLEFNFGGWSGVINSFGKINGVESENHDEMNNKPKKVIKGLIEKHLAGKKRTKNPPTQAEVAQPAAVPQQQPSIEEPQIPIEAVEALFKLFSEKQAK